jgi:hypothetical protein
MSEFIKYTHIVLFKQLTGIGCPYAYPATSFEAGEAANTPLDRNSAKNEM